MPPVAPSPSGSLGERRLDAVFNALANPTRRAILVRLSSGSASVTELAAPFTVTLPAITKHLKVLEEAELVTRTVEGRIHRLALAPQPPIEATRWFDRYQRFWTDSLSSLARHANTDRNPRSDQA